MRELLGMQFMQLALIAAAVTGLAAPAVGTFLVQRRLALMGDGIGHVAVAGVAIGLATSTSPTWTAVAVAVAGAVAMEVIRERSHTNGDVALALLFYGGIAAGVLITGLAGQSAARLQQFLFGSITTVSVADVIATAVLAAVVLALVFGNLPQLFASAQDPDFARVAGVNVRLHTMLVAVLAAVSVTVAMRTVGLLLVSALMVVPVAASQQLSRSFRATIMGAIALGLASSLGGLLLAAQLSVTFGLSLAPGPTIVLLALVFFTLAWPVGVIVRKRSRARAPFAPVVPAEHTVAAEHGDHVHNRACGHRAVPHGDHVDYIHDGHRHAPHGEHYDEH